MKKIIVVTLVCFSLLACKERVKTDVQVDISSKDSAQIEHDSLAASLDNIDLIESETYPKADNLPLSILTTGVFHGDETSPDMINKGWFGVFQDRERYYVAPTTLSIKKAFDAVFDDDEHDPSKWTGWEVRTSHIDPSLVLISSCPQLKDRQIDVVTLKQMQIPIHEVETFHLNDVTYALFATGEMARDEFNENEIVYSNYKLFLKGKRNGKEITQLLAYTPGFEDTMFEILLVGDIDGDGFPDLILNTTHHYNMYRPTVYLSSFADKDQLLKVVGLHESVGC